MLVITKALKDWRQFLEGLSEAFEIYTDHCNLEFWRTSQHLTHCQACWALFLADYDFVLIHKPEIKNSAADRLSRDSRHAVTDAGDNQDQIVLLPEHFHSLAAAHFANTTSELGSAEPTPSPLKQRIRNCLDRKSQIVESLKALKAKGPCRLANNLIK